MGCYSKPLSCKHSCMFPVSLIACGRRVTSPESSSPPFMVPSTSDWAENRAGSLVFFPLTSVFRVSVWPEGTHFPRRRGRPRHRTLSLPWSPFYRQVCGPVAVVVALRAWLPGWGCWCSVTPQGGVIRHAVERSLHLQQRSTPAATGADI